MLATKSKLKSLSEQMLPALEQEMRSVLRYEGQRSDDFYGMLHYHMGWVDKQLAPTTSNSGKQIRPLLCLLTTAAAGGDWRQAVPAGAAVEILHNFSLIHDDIEDVSPTRRGRETVWHIWGQALAINSGDAMFALSHLALTRLAERDVPPATVVRALRRFDETCVALTAGQHADMNFELRDDVEVEEYIAMITGKTAVLLSLSAELGALIAGADEETIAHFAAFGLNLGLAFQVIDDILGIWGDESKTGKSVSTDIITKKKTLPVLYGLERSSALARLYVETEVPDEAFVAQVVAYLDETGAGAYAQERARRYSDQALEHLQAAAPQGDAGLALQQLADMLLKRDF